MANDYRIVFRDDSEHLQHWKYIKKERGKNGKWRYYYNLGSDEQDAYNKAKRDYNTVKDFADDIDDTIEKYSTSRWTPRHGTLPGGIKNTGWMDNAKYMNNELRTDREVAKAWARTAQKEHARVIASKKKVDKAYAEYKKTPLYKINALIDAGKALFKKLFG